MALLYMYARSLSSALFCLSCVLSLMFPLLNHFQSCELRKLGLLHKGE